MLPDSLAFHDANLFGAALAGIPMLVNIGILVFVFRRLPRDPLTRTFVLFVGSMIFWQLFDVGTRLAADAHTARFLRGYFRVGQIFVAPLGLHFATLYAERDRLAASWTFWAVLYLPPVFQVGGFMAGHLSDAVHYVPGWGWVGSAPAPTMDPVYMAHLYHASLLSLGTLGMLGWTTWTVRNDPKRFRPAALLTGSMAVVVLTGIVTEVVLPAVGRPQVSLLSTVSLLLSITIAIALGRYEFLRVNTPAIAKAMADALTDPLLVAAPDGSLLYANAAAFEQFGLDPAVLRSHHLSAIFANPDETTSFFAGRWQATLGGQRIHGLEVELQGRDGRSIFLLSLAPVPIGRDGDPAVALVAHDVSRLKAIENDLVEARDQAEFANRAKSEFLANMSHELRTPLNAIIGYAELLEEDCDVEEMRADLRRIQRSGRYLLDLINDVLDLSKVESGRLEVEPIAVDLRDTLEALDPIFRQLVERNRNTFAVELPDGPVRVYADPVRLRQVLLNLVSNAAKFTEAGRIDLYVERRGDRVWIDITDTGIGMAPEVVGRLFTMFTQVHRIDREKYGGTGLGLALSKRLCNLMGGDVRLVKTELGAGSTFRIELPIGPPG